MSIWKANLQTTGKILFCFTLLVGIIMFLWCFIRCPANLSKLYGHTEVNYKYVLYFLSAFALWVLLLTCSCCLWHDNAVFLCWHWYQRNHHQKHSLTTEGTKEDNVNKKNEEHKREVHEDATNPHSITVTYRDERQLEESNVCSVV